MAKAKTVFLAALAAVMLVSCPTLFERDEEDLFYAQNTSTGAYYQVKAEILYEGTKCVIWAEKGSGVTTSQAKSFADEYDAAIRPMVIREFSKPGSDILDYANQLAGRDDGKLTILLLDIQDSYNGRTNLAYVAGYFFNGNFQPKGNITGTHHHSNSRDMIYIDTYPGLRTETRQTYATFAHELQHLVNFVTSVQFRTNSAGYTQIMDTWVDEGLSSQAEYFYLKETPGDKRSRLDDSQNTIKTGNNFFVWGNHDYDQYAILDDYATVYLFFRWLYLQAASTGQSNIFHDIITSSHPNFRAVTAAAAKIDGSWNNWEPLLQKWFFANYYPQDVSYGYANDQELSGIIKIPPIGGSSIDLYPGEGVYSIINGSYTPPITTAEHIRYVELTGNTQKFLLTFNANEIYVKDDDSEFIETGSLTGVSPSISQTTADNSRQAGKWNGPYVIDARDMLARNRK